MPRYTLHSKTKIKICFSQVVTKQQKVVIITILKEKKIKAILKYLPKGYKLQRNLGDWTKI